MAGLLSKQQMGEREPNPMLIDVVVQKVVEYAQLSDLKNLRQVSRLWFQESLPRWRRDMWLQLSERDLGDGTLTVDKYLELTDENATGDTLQLAKYPFRKFILNVWEFPSETAQQLKSTSFWSKFGGTMTHLEIKRSVFRSQQDFELILFQLVPNLEVLNLNGNTYIYDKPEGLPETRPELTPRLNLKKLQFNATDVYCDYQFPLTFLELFGHYPNIKNLELTGISSPGFSRKFEGILNAMIMLREQWDYKWKLENLDILNMHSNHQFEFEPEHAWSLQQLQLPLSSLSLDIGDGTEPGTFWRILITHASTLRKLVVYRHGGRSIIPDVSHRNFPFGIRMEALEELRLLGSAVCPNLKFLQFMPNLRSLYLLQETGSSMLDAAPFASEKKLLEDVRQRQTAMQWKYGVGVYPIQNTDFSELEGMKLEKMEEFILCGKADKICTGKQVDGLANLMPNLKRLRLGLGNDGFRVACDAWKELEVLMIQPCQVDDSGITGSISRLQMQLPKLMDLSRLRYFAFGVETPPKSKVYLEDSAVYGVSTFKNLLTDTTAPPSYQISNEALEAFTAKFSRCEIVRFNGGVEEWPELRRRDNGDSSDDESSEDFEEDMIDVLKFNNELMEKERREELGLDSEDENESDEIEELSGDERNDNENPE